MGRNSGESRKIEQLFQIHIGGALAWEVQPYWEPGVVAGERAVVVEVFGRDANWSNSGQTRKAL